MARVLHTPTLAAPAPTATVGGSTSLDASITAQLGLTALSLSATSLSAGATIAWTVYGPDGSDQTANLITAGADTATPTWAAFSASTGAIAGLWLIAATVTSGSLSTRYTRRLLVGDADGRVQKHHADWTLAGSANDFNTTATKTVDGQEYTAYKPGTVNSFAATENVGLSMDPNSADCGVQVPGDAQGVTLQTEVVYYAALAAGTFDTNSDTFKIVIQGSAVYGVALARRSSGGVYQIGTETAAGSAYETTAGAGPITILAIKIRGYQLEVGYSEAAFTGVFPAFSGLTRASTAPSGFFTLDNVPGNDTTDSRAPASDVVRWVVTIASTGAVVMTDSEIRVAA